jgi:hypothetical protein
MPGKAIASLKSGKRIRVGTKSAKVGRNLSSFKIKFVQVRETGYDPG